MPVAVEVFEGKVLLVDRHKDFLAVVEENDDDLFGQEVTLVVVQPDLRLHRLVLLGKDWLGGIKGVGYLQQLLDLEGILFIVLASCGRGCGKRTSETQQEEES